MSVCFKTIVFALRHYNHTTIETQSIQMIFHYFYFNIPFDLFILYDTVDAQIWVYT